MKKAIEYVNKYQEQLNQNEEEIFEEAAKQLMFDLIKEIEELSEIRKAKTNKSFINIVKEINQKYNKIVRILPTDKATYILKEDGFKTFVKKIIPEISIYL